MTNEEQLAIVAHPGGEHSVSGFHSHAIAPP
jgi:hypothetical protein